MRVGPRQDWDFYPCRVDGAPASISLNLWFLDNPTPEDCTTLVQARVEMHDPGRHGMGTRQEAESFRALENALRDAARRARFHLVGRVRTGGRWQLCWYGPAPGARALRSQLSEVAAAHPGRVVTTEVLDDPSWSFLHEFLAPDEHSRRWMADRRVVDHLLAHGDAVDVPRPVDHWVRFDAPDAASAFEVAACSMGFRVVESTAGDEPRLHLQRTDPVRLIDIHEVATGLRFVASRYAGEYEGWGCEVVRQGAT